VVTSVPDDGATKPPLPLRARPPQVLLGVGAALLVTAAAVVASAYGDGWAHGALFAGAAIAAALSLRASALRLRSSEETFAVCATALGLAGSDLSGRLLDGSPLIAAVLAVVFLLLHRRSLGTAAWPLASWSAGQLAVLRALDGVPQQLHPELFLCVALVGLGIALFARRLVARVALGTSAPWWLAGVVGGSSSAWADSGAVQWVSAALMIAAGSGLVLARLRDALDPLLGPPRLVPVVAGTVSGAAVAGAFSSLGPLSMTLTGYAGVLIATLAANFLNGWHRGLFLPIALSGGVVMAALCVAQLMTGGDWGRLSLLLLLTAAPTVLVAVHRPDDRHIAVPAAVGCLAGAVLLAVAAGHLGPSIAAILLTGLYGATMTVGAGLEPHTRHATAGAAAACALAALLLLVANGGAWAPALHLAVQGLCTLGFAWRSGRRHGSASSDDMEESPHVAAGAWRVGAAQLVLAGWIAVAEAGLPAIEWYSLPAAAGLLLAAGPRLSQGPSWPAWGPALLMAAVPSTVSAAATSAGPREVIVLLVAAVAMIGGARWSVRAPVLVGAGTALALSLGLVVRQLPWPLGTALLVGTALLGLGMLRERRPVAGFSARLADLR
jgi:hypothetical protein